MNIDLTDHLLLTNTVVLQLMHIICNSADEETTKALLNLVGYWAKEGKKLLED